MMNTEVVVVGAGPAGLAAALRLDELGIKVVVVDGQASPGGQIWRMVERRAASPAAEPLGDEYRSGLEQVARFRASDVVYLPNAEVWRIENGWSVSALSAGRTIVVRGKCLILATGARERPVSFPGCTLPGVLTVGAAQILLKTSGMVPERPVWIAASGVLPLLYIHQLRRAGVPVGGILQTSTMRNMWLALRHLPRAMPAWRQLVKGLGWQVDAAMNVKLVRHVAAISAEGDTCLQRVVYETTSGKKGVIETPVLLVHEGLVPDSHMTFSIGCKHDWDQNQLVLLPVVDCWFETSKTGAFIAGDGARIGGAEAASIAGEIAAFGVARRLGRTLTIRDFGHVSELRHRMSRVISIRPFLDMLYRPRKEALCPGDSAIICRCEEVTAAQIREAIAGGAVTLNQLKARTRVGMGRCQGRQCGHIVVALLEDSKGVADVHGYFTVRPPLKPITLGELAAMQEP